MGNPEFKNAWAVIDKNGINVRSVSPERRTAIVNWLVVAAGCHILNKHTDEHIESLWSAHSPLFGAHVARVMITPWRTGISNAES